MNPVARAARHGRWFRLLTDADWRRIEALAEQVSEIHTPAALDDLEAPLRVGVCPVGDEHHHNGERIGTLKGGTVAVLVWDLTERELARRLGAG